MSKSSQAPFSTFFQSCIIRRPFPEAVIYDLRCQHETKIFLPIGSKWTSGLHWHETHTEYLQIVRGTVRVVLDGQEIIISASKGESRDSSTIVKVEKGARHEWSRAKPVNEGEEVMVIERTDPEDGQKNIFFWNVNGVVLDGIENIKTSRSGFSRWIAKWLLWWKLCLVFRELDNFPVFENMLTISQVFQVNTLNRWLGWLSTHTILASAGVLGFLYGARGVRKEYTPEDIWQRWLSSKSTTNEKAKKSH